MYGLVNAGVRDMVVDAGGEELWKTVRERAGVEDDQFTSLQHYEDEITMNLVAAASEALGLDPDEILKGFGKHWIEFTGRVGYGPMMEMAGDSLQQFLANLDQMHARIKISMIDLDPPGFSCSTREDGVAVVKYYSSRRGLVPMVIGLFEGLADKFGQSVTITHVKEKVSMEEPDVLEVQFLDQDH